MRGLLLVTAAAALAPITTPPKRTAFRENVGGATKEAAVAVGAKVDCAARPIAARDVVIRCYDISGDGKLAPALSLATFKQVHWFPKLTCSVGDRAWAYDGEVEPTSNTVVARAAGPPVFEFNLGACVYDDAGIDDVLANMAVDYNEEEYDFFFRNCNHFADDLGRRLSDGNEVPRSFMDDYVLCESESLLCNMASFQRSMTMAVRKPRLAWVPSTGRRLDGVDVLALSSFDVRAGRAPDPENRHRELAAELEAGPGRGGGGLELAVILVLGEGGGDWP